MSEPGYRRPESVLVVVYAYPREGAATAEGGTGDVRVLLLERRDRPGFWQSVTGSLEAGETPAKAARRELAEETGLEGEPTDLRKSRRFEIFPEFRHRFPPGATHNLEHAFAFEAPEAGAVRLNRDEHRHYRWLPWRDAAALTESWTNRAAIEELFGVGESRR